MGDRHFMQRRGPNTSLYVRPIDETMRLVLSNYEILDKSHNTKYHASKSVLQLVWAKIHSWGFTSFDFISSCPIVTNFISDLMKSKPISLNMVIFVMFISRSISTLVNQEDSPTLSKTYLSGPISTSSQDHLQDHQEYLRTISRTIIRTISGPPRNAF